MNKIYHLLLAFLFAPALTIQAQSTFSKVYFGPVLSNGLLAQGQQKGFLLAASLPPQTALSGCDSAGNIMWSKATNKDLNCGNLVSALDTTYYVAAVSDTLGTVIKLNAHGDVLWSKSLHVNGYRKTVPLSIALCSDSGFAVCGYALGSSLSLINAYAAKFDKNGTLSWSKVITGPDSLVFNSLAQTPDSGFIAVGSLHENTTILCKLDKTGTISWCQKYTDTTSAKTQGIGVAVWDRSAYAYIFSNSAPVLLKCDLAGNTLFSKKYSPLGQGTFNSGAAGYKMGKTLDHQLYLTWSAFYVNGGLKADTLGNPAWSFYSPTCGTDLIQMNDGHFLNAANGPVLGVKMSGYNPAYSGVQIGVSKFDSSFAIGAACPSRANVSQSNIILSMTPINYTQTTSGSVQVFSLSTISTNISVRVGCPDITGGFDELTNPDGFSIFPNPTDSKIQILSKKRIPNTLRYCIFNLSGQMVVEGTTNYAEGDHTIDCSALSPSVYLLKIIAEGRVVETKKLIVRP